jgi:NAD(P)-dependent dehydrogenase (short-subunit alcohol dehydrogenase family)
MLLEQHWRDCSSIRPSLAQLEAGPTASKDKPFASGQRRYSISKLANIYFTYALAGRLPSGVTVNAFDPVLVQIRDEIQFGWAPRFD